MKFNGPNHPFVVCASCFLWLVSLFAIMWSLVLFFCVGDMLLLTETDLVNAFVLLSGIIMLPTNVHMLYAIANGKKIDHKCKVVCCPLWLCILWIIVINIVGAVLCVQRLHSCKETTMNNISKSIQQYRNVPQYKHFIDNMQWSLKCCGLNSYRDWFHHDWYDKIRDYEWDPSINSRSHRKAKTVADSVPLSCCKSGSCVSNYLTELGTYSINTKGCCSLMNTIVMISMGGHFLMFLAIIITEMCLLKYVVKINKDCNERKDRVYNVKHIMSINDNFEASSTSCQLNPDDSDDDDGMERRRIPSDNVKMEIYKGAALGDAYKEYSDSQKKISQQ